MIIVGLHFLAETCSNIVLSQWFLSFVGFNVWSQDVMDKTNLMEQADSTILVYENFDEGQGFLFF